MCLAGSRPGGLGKEVMADGALDFIAANKQNVVFLSRADNRRLFLTSGASPRLAHFAQSIHVDRRKGHPGEVILSSIAVRMPWSEGYCVQEPPTVMSFWA